jgi:hypothetical protein
MIVIVGLFISNIFSWHSFYDCNRRSVHFELFFVAFFLHMFVIAGLFISTAQSITFHFCARTIGSEIMVEHPPKFEATKTDHAHRRHVHNSSFCRRTLDFCRKKLKTFFFLGHVRASHISEDYTHIRRMYVLKIVNAMIATYLWPILQIFGERIGDFIETQCFGYFLSQNCHFFLSIFCDNILKIITSTPSPSRF